MVFFVCYILPMIEKAWEGITLAPTRLDNDTPAWMCLTREGLDQKERRDKKNERARIRKRKYRSKQLQLAFCSP